MRTRTLLLLALGCGLLIMLAGAVFLFQLAGQDDAEPPIAIGEVVRVADMTVVVEEAVEAGDWLDVTIRIGGVDDTAGASEFRLIASGRPVHPELPTSDDSCGATTVAERVCVARFNVSEADGSSRVLFYERGEDQARWILS